MSVDPDLLDHLRSEVTSRGWVANFYDAVLDPATLSQRPAYLVTCGLSERGLVDILFLPGRAPAQTSAALLQQVVNRLVERREARPQGTPSCAPPGAPAGSLVLEASGDLGITVALVPLDPTYASICAPLPKAIAAQAGAHLRCMQLLVPDGAGRFPWDAGCENQVDHDIGLLAGALIAGAGQADRPPGLVWRH